MEEEKIIQLEQGFSHVKNEGIVPFLEMIESDERQSFKAKLFVSLYDVIFKMCVQREPYNWSADMYEKYTASILEYLEKTCHPALNQAKASYETDFLKEWASRWHKHNLVVKGLSQLFMYLDRFYTPNTDGVLPLKEQAFKCYREKIFNVFAPTAAQYILNCVQRERNGEEQDRHLLSQAVAVFSEMGYKYGDARLKLYQDMFEKPMIQHAGEYYKRKSRQWMDEDSAPSYLQKAEQCLQQEKGRVEAYMNNASLDPLYRECHNQMLKEHQNELLHKATGANHMLEMKRSDDLSRLFRLYSKYSDELEPIAALVGEYIKKVGCAVVDKAKPLGGKDAPPAEEKAGAPDHSLIRDLIDLHTQFASVVKECFQNNQSFQRALKGAFEDFINRDNRVSKLLAKFANDILKKNSRTAMGQQGANIENILNHVVFLYGYLSDKDVFERDYQHYLAQRLLLGLTESEHDEKSMIAKLKTECGYQWTNRLEGMFRDVQNSQNMMLKFKGDPRSSELGLDLIVTVCTTGYWPTAKFVPCTIPQDLTRACDAYKSFYLGQFSGHKIEWRMDQGQAEVSVFFNPKTKKLLTCSTYQMMILLAFNSSTKPLNLQTILTVTGIPKFDIQDHLLSLCHPNVKVLLKRPNVNKLEDGDEFKINPEFESKAMKISVPLYRKEKKDDEEQKAIELQRGHQMDASIVRIMKIRKTLKHNRLVAEVMQQLSARFKPNPAHIKKRIEALIDQEYLKRDEQDRSLYTYLA